MTEECHSDPLLDLVTFHDGDEGWHDGPGWYYTIDDYLDEGSCGAFKTFNDAMEHAEEAMFDRKLGFTKEELDEMECVNDVCGKSFEDGEAFQELFDPPLVRRMIERIRDLEGLTRGRHGQVEDLIGILEDAESAARLANERLVAYEVQAPDVVSRYEGLLEQIREAGLSWDRAGTLCEEGNKP